MTLSPAFGRDYKSRAAIVKDLNAQLDFMMNSFNASGYCSVRDLPDGDVQVRDKSMRKVWMITVSNGVAR